MNLGNLLFGFYLEEIIMSLALSARFFYALSRLERYSCFCPKFVILSGVEGLGAISCYPFQSFMFLKKKHKRISISIRARNHHCEVQSNYISNRPLSKFKTKSVRNFNFTQNNHKLVISEMTKMNRPTLNLNFDKGYNY